MSKSSKGRDYSEYYKNFKKRGSGKGRRHVKKPCSEAGNQHVAN
jgi:hypothetical protein